MRNRLDVSNDLITYFIQLVKKKTGEKAIVNRGKVKYSVAEILQDWTSKEIKTFLDFYVKTETQPDLTDFCNRYDKIIQDMKVEKKDADERKTLMSETQKAVLKFRETYKGAK